jgi:hypothetical protein
MNNIKINTAFVIGLLIFQNLVRADEASISPKNSPTNIKTEISDINLEKNLAQFVELLNSEPSPKEWSKWLKSDEDRKEFLLDMSKIQDLNKTPLAAVGTKLLIPSGKKNDRSRI